MALHRRWGHVAAHQRLQISNGVRRVVVDPNDAGKIYIFNVRRRPSWHGPAAGDPNALEDGATPLSKK